MLQSDEIRSTIETLQRGLDLLPVREDLLGATVHHVRTVSLYNEVMKTKRTHALLKLWIPFAFAAGLAAGVTLMTLHLPVHHDTNDRAPVVAIERTASPPPTRIESGMSIVPDSRLVKKLRDTIWKLRRNAVPSQSSDIGNSGGE
jgi:hypothetical protein